MVNSEDLFVQSRKFAIKGDLEDLYKELASAYGKINRLDLAEKLCKQISDTVDKNIIIDPEAVIVKQVDAKKSYLQSLYLKSLSGNLSIIIDSKNLPFSLKKILILYYFSYPRLHLELDHLFQDDGFVETHELMRLFLAESDKEITETTDRGAVLKIYQTLLKDEFFDYSIKEAIRNFALQNEEILSNPSWVNLIIKPRKSLEKSKDSRKLLLELYFELRKKRSFLCFFNLYLNWANVESEHDIEALELYGFLNGVYSRFCESESFEKNLFLSEKELFNIFKRKFTNLRELQKL